MTDSAAHPHHRIDYVELTAPDLAAIKTFYGRAFGWTFTDYGPGYVGFSDGRAHAGAAVEGGGFRRVDAKSAAGEGAPLIILYSDSLESSLERVRGAGGSVTKDIFAFPGGRRFHFADPAGNELAVWSAK